MKQFFRLSMALFGSNAVDLQVAPVVADDLATFKQVVQSVQVAFFTHQFILLCGFGV
jgi:hypothetical protein